MEKIMERAKEINHEIVAHRRQFHKHPETGLDLPMTKAYVIQELKKMGYMPKEYGKSSVAAVAGGKRPGKAFLIRGDMDALPIQEETGLPFASDNGSMHACGHDCHAAMLLGAAKLLKEMEDELDGRVKLFFQSAEETMEGAKEAVEAGVLTDPDVAAAMMIHVMSGTPIPSGRLTIFEEGPSYASVDWFRVDIQGKGGHGASPDITVSPLGIMSHIYQCIQDIIATGIPASAHAVMTVGEMHGGATSNIIPDTAYMAGTIRTFDQAVQAQIKDRLIQTAEGVAALKGGKAKVTFSISAPSLVCDRGVSEDVIGALKKHLGEAHIVDVKDLFGPAPRMTGSEDFAYVAQKVPATVALLSAGTVEEGYTYPGHHPKTDFKEDVLYVGAAAYVSGAVEWLSKHK